MYLQFHFISNFLISIFKLKNDDFRIFSHHNPFLTPMPLKSVCTRSLFTLVFRRSAFDSPSGQTPFMIFFVISKKIYPTYFHLTQPWSPYYDTTGIQICQIIDSIIKSWKYCCFKGNFSLHICSVKSQFAWWPNETYQKLGVNQAKWNLTEQTKTAFKAKYISKI